LKRSVVIASAALAATVLTPTTYALAHVKDAPVSDLSATVTGPATVLPGQRITYEVAVHNAGPDDAANPWVYVNYSRALSIRSSDMTGIGGSCGYTLGEPEFGCNVAGGVPVGATKIVTITATVDPHASGEVALKAEARIKNDPDTAGNSGTVNTAIGAAADLGVALTGPATAKRGDWVTYEAKVSNRGAKTGTGTKLTLRLPGGVTYNGSPLNCTPQGYDVTCDLGDLAVNAAKTVQVSGKVDGDTPIGRRLDAAAKVRSDLPDPVAADDAATFSTTVVAPTPPPAPPKADVVVSGKASALRKGRTGTYAIVVANKGPNAAKNVVVTGALPKGMTFKSVRGCKRFKNGIKCTIPSLKAGGKVTITLNVTVVKGAKSGSRTFVVIARSATKDPVAGNNVARIKRSVTK